MATNGPQNIQTAASGQVLQGAGVGVAPAFSTATYPATATGTGKILRADGTNWVATTATFPDTAGSSGNVLQSNGTNWSSAAPSSSAGLTACLATATGNTGLSLSLVAGDYLKWGFTGPVWTTNPTTVSFSGTFST
jgi:hypothetical protein